MSDADPMSTTVDFQRRICASTVRSEYHLSQKDLDEIPYVEARNPHYRNAAPMRLFEVSDVEEYVEWKQVYFSAESKASRKEEERQRYRDLAHSYSAAATALQKKTDNYDEQIPLDNDVLSRVMEVMAEEVEPFGVYGPSLAAQDLAQVAQTCKQMHRAHHAGIKRLGVVMVNAADKYDRVSVPSAVRHSADEGETSPYNSIMLDPLAVSLTKLKEACRDLGDCKVTGDKAELAGHLLIRLRLAIPSSNDTNSDTEHRQQNSNIQCICPCPTFAPLCTVWAVRLERDTLEYERFYSSASSQFATALQTFTVISGCLGRHVRSQKNFYYASRSALAKTHGIRCDRNLIHFLDNYVREKQNNCIVGAKKCVVSACEQIPSATCSMNMCGSCCKARKWGLNCQRHFKIFSRL
jgi:hypothetical protein